MIELVQQRIKLLPTATIAAFYWAGSLDWFILEDQMREIPGKPVGAWKEFARTAIPVGRYRVVMDMSARFKRMMPHILDVPGFDGIRYHGAGDIATPANTEGCPLLGYSANILAGTVGQSLPASLNFRERLTKAVLTDEVWVTVKNPV